MTRHMPLPLLIAALVVSALSDAWAYEEAETSGAFNRRAFFTQPMGYSIWKPSPASVDAFVQLLEAGRLNASREQFAQALHDAGWIGDNSVGTAVAYLRTLREGSARETEMVRLGRILRSYDTGEGILDDHFYQVVGAGESGYFDAAGRMVVRVRCLNVVYPDKRAAADASPSPSPSPSPSATGGGTPQPTPASADPEMPPDVQFNAPGPFYPPAREIQEPASRSAP